jgi:hypothetical protein
MLAFVHIAKTGGVTIASMLRSAHGARHCEATSMRPRPQGDPGAVRFMIPKYGPEDIAVLKSVMPGMRSLSGHHVALWSGVEEIFPDTRYFLFLRDPLRRGASHYQFHVDHDDYTRKFGFRHFPWDKWVEWETHHNHQLKMISPDVDVDQAIAMLERSNVFVGLMEHFDESLVMMEKLFCPGLDIAYRRRNTARDNTLARSLLDDPRRAAQIREMYAKEFPLYEYVSRELYPRYRHAYGPTLAADVARFREHGRDRVSRRNILLHRLYRELVFLPRLRKRQGVYR